MPPKTTLRDALHGFAPVMRQAVRTATSTAVTVRTLDIGRGVSDLLAYLLDKPAGVAILDLPVALQNPDLLADLDDREHVEFGDLGSPWPWGARRPPQYKAWSDILAELRAGNNRVLGIRLTRTGRVQARAETKPAERTETAKPKQARKRSSRSQPTERELRVMELVSRGFTNADVARELGITPQRVHQLRKSVMRLAGTPSRSVDSRRGLPKQV